MARNYSTGQPGLDAPCEGGAAVTASDTTADPAGPFKCLYVGGAGDVKVTTVGGDTITFSSVPAGTVLPWRVSRVWSNGTTASNVLGGY